MSSFKVAVGYQSRWGVPPAFLFPQKMNNSFDFDPVNTQVIIHKQGRNLLRNYGIFLTLEQYVVYLDREQV